MTPEQLMEMRSLIAMELELHGVPLGKDTWLGLDAVQIEVTQLITTIPHEGKIPSCGVIFAEVPDDLGEVRVLSVPESQIDLARKLADGTNSFLLFKREKFIGLVFFPEALATELELVRAFPVSGGLIVQRNSSGATKMFRQDDIVLHENRAWFTKPHVREAAKRISHCVAGVDHSVLNGILEFSFHLLSPASRTGATLVWQLEDVTEDADLSVFNLSLSSERDSVAACHFLSQTDGATILGPTGKLLRSGVHLTYSDRSSKLIPEFKGTRHTSARRYSYDNSKTLVITVSEDGPVTVFSDGASIADLQMYSSKQEAKNLKSAVPEKKEDISYRSFEMECKSCGKTSMVEEVRVIGSDELKTVPCLICQAPLLSTMCFSLDSRPFKKITL